MFRFLVALSLVASALGASIPGGMLPQLDGRIVGGQATTIANFPYVVSLQRSGSHSCGGSIYSTTIIITAAHCLQNVAASSLKIRAGSTDRTSGGTLLNVARFVNKPDYDPNSMVNDVAVIKLAAALTLGSNVQPIDLVSKAPAAGTPATVCGWGTTAAGSSFLPTTLEFVEVDIVSLEQCASDAYNYANAIKPTMICAIAAKKDSCQGDSGGPLAVAGGQAGIVSWGYGCAMAKYPGVYSDVAALRPWIVEAASYI